MTTDKMTSNLNEWILAKQPKCHIPIYKFDKTFYLFGENKRFSVVGDEAFVDMKGIRILTVRDFETEDKLTLKSWDGDSKFEKNNSKIIYKLQKEHREDVQRGIADFISRLSNAKEDHPFFIKKQIDPFDGIKVFNNSLIIPSYSFSKKEIVSYEKIYQKTTGDFKKVSCTKTSKKNTYFPIGEVKDTIFISENFETAMTIYKVTGEFSIFSFGKNSAYDIAKNFSETYKIKPIVISCDLSEAMKGSRDSTGEEKKNTNKDYIETPSPIDELNEKLIYNGLVNVFTIYPKFSFPAGASSFNELYLLDKEECIFQLNPSQILGDFVTPLTFQGESPVVWSHDSGIFYLDKKASKENLIRLADKNYWKRFGKNKGEPNWRKASESIIIACSKNKLQYSDLKTRGVYKDRVNNELIINTGKGLIGHVEDKTQVYLPSSRLEPHFPDPRKYHIKEDILAYFMEFLLELNWKNKYDCYLFMSWICLVPYYNTLNFVPHLSINGNSSTGKTFLINNIAYRLLKKFNPIIINRGTTLPGFLRKIREENITICLFEENENLNPLQNEDWLNIFRISSTSNHEEAKIIKSKPGGIGVTEYSVKIIASLFGISSIISKPQDEKRFLSINLIKKKKSNDFIKISNTIKKMNLEHLGLTLYGNMYERYSEFVDQHKMFYEDLLKMETTGHESNKIAYLMASAKINLGLSPDEIQGLFEYAYGDNLSEDAYSYFDHIMERLLVTEVHEKDRGTTLEALTKIEKTEIRNLLNQQGVFVKNDFLYIDKKNTFLPYKVFKGQFDDNNYKQNWVHFLKNCEIVEEQRAFFLNRRRYCFKIPLKQLPIDKRTIESIKKRHNNEI